MDKPDPKKPLVALLLTLVAVVGIDQGTKQWALRDLMTPTFLEQTDQYPVCGNNQEEARRERFIRRHREPVDVIAGHFSFKYVENCASAFGLMSRVPESFRFPFFLVVSLAALGFIPYLYLRTPARQRMLLWALPFVLGGALGNLLDRLIYRYVIDFVDWYVTIGGEEKHWPTFNVADAAIVIGIGLMLIEMWPRSQRDPHPAPADGQHPAGT